MSLHVSPLRLTPAKSALVLIDLQHAVVAIPLQPRSAQSVVQTCHRMAAAFREKGGQIIYVRVDLANMQPLAVDRSRVDPDAPPPPPVASEIIPDAGFQQGDLLVTKRHWGAFGPTGLEHTIKERGIDTIVLGGIATNFGVESTARQAVAHGFHVVVAEDACSSLDAAAHQFAIGTIFPLMARVRTSQEIIDALD